jgi:hypothetical protein
MGGSRTAHTTALFIVWKKKIVVCDDPNRV